MAETVSTNQFRNGMHVQLDGSVWRIVEFQHVKPGKGGAFVRTKLKQLDSGAVVDRTFRAGEKFARVHTEDKGARPRGAGQQRDEAAAARDGRGRPGAALRRPRRARQGRSSRRPLHLARLT